jgi:hypothetical protein
MPKHPGPENGYLGPLGGAWHAAPAGAPAFYLSPSQWSMSTFTVVVCVWPFTESVTL